MDREKVINRIKQYIEFVTVIKSSSLNEDLSLKEYYKIDIWDFYEIIVGIEDIFDVELSNEDERNIDTINKIADIVLKNNNSI